MRLLIISNRLPVSVKKQNNKITYKNNNGGLVSGLKCLQENMDFLWIGNINGDFTESEKQKIKEELLKKNSIPVFISHKLNHESYDNFCNSILWPLLHSFSDDLFFDMKIYESYKNFNYKFFEVISEIIQDDDIVWVHDYHLMLLPKMIKESFNNKVGFFLHTAFPEPDVFNVMPFKDEILQSLISTDLIAFHTYQYLSSFKKTCLALIDMKICDCGNQYCIKKFGFNENHNSSHFDCSNNFNFKNSVYSKILKEKDKNKNSDKNLSFLNQKSDNFFMDCQPKNINKAELNMNLNERLTNQNLDNKDELGFRMNIKEEVVDIIMNYDNLNNTKSINDSEKTISEMNSFNENSKIKLPKMEAIPIGTDPLVFKKTLEKEETILRIKEIRKKFEGKKIIIGVDRTDYIKGIPNRIEGYNRALSKYPELRDKTVFFQIGVPSRMNINGYSDLVDVIKNHVGTINSLHGSVDTNLFYFLNNSVDFDELCALYASADICIVSSLVDGMNLVSMEYVACQDKNKGILLLSEFAGSLSTLPASLGINPYDLDNIADAIKKAVDMDMNERERRHMINYEAVYKFSGVRWAETNLKFIKE